VVTVEVEERTDIATRTGLKNKLLTGKVAVVTGASRGIGAAIARELGAYGSQLVLNYARNAQLAEELAQEIQTVELPEQPGAVVAVRADVRDKVEATRLMQEVWERFGRLDILVNNAGVTHDHTFKKMTVEEWEDVIATDLNGVFYCTHAAMPYLLEHEGGKVINIGSTIGLSGNIGQASYAAAKAGLIGPTKSLALEWARHDVTVNCVAPGYTETDMLAKVAPEMQEKIFQRIPLHRFGTVEEVASLVRYLCTEGDYITGQVISINGGLYV
jgi:NAD(P)-dependent dehydrogenase (short-subunit alcohol dehydrogenase family)